MGAAVVAYGTERWASALGAPGVLEYSDPMKTTSAQQLPMRWPEILHWVAAGEEVQVTQHDQVVAKVVPARPAATPDFLARAKAIWGEAPPGTALSAVVSDQGLLYRPRS